MVVLSPHIRVRIRRLASNAVVTRGTCQKPQSARRCDVEIVVKPRTRATGRARVLVA